MITGVKHIIFDLGGVLLNIDYALTEKAFTDAGIVNFADMYTQLGQSDLFDQLETGKIGREQFVAAIRDLCPVPITEEKVIECWNAMLLDFPVRRLQLLQQLRLYYDLVLLSNTNEIHEEAFNKIIYSDRGIPNIGVFFDKVYFSHRVGMRKPNKDIFERILEECSFKPGETLFIDDSLQHIATAKELGIQTIYLEKGMTIEEHIFKSLK
jgi:HAD superfamily hydrolase (TIGR01509 family)